MAREGSSHEEPWGAMPAWIYGCARRPMKNLSSFAAHFMLKQSVTCICYTFTTHDFDSHITHD